MKVSNYSWLKLSFSYCFTTISAWMFLINIPAFKMSLFCFSSHLPSHSPLIYSTCGIYPGFGYIHMSQRYPQRRNLNNTHNMYGHWSMLNIHCGMAPIQIIFFYWTGPFIEAQHAMQYCPHPFGSHDNVIVHSSLTNAKNCHPASHKGFWALWFLGWYHMTMCELVVVCSVQIWSHNTLCACLIEHFSGVHDCNRTTVHFKKCIDKKENELSSKFKSLKS